MDTITGSRVVGRSLATLAACGALATLGASPASGAAGAGAGNGDRGPLAQAARTLNVTESASLRRVSLRHTSKGPVLTQRGTATGTLSGSVSARWKIGVTSVTGTVTITTRQGSVTFNASGRLRSASGGKARYSGTLAARSGTGVYDDVVGAVSWDGVVNRSNWSASVNARGRLTI